MKTASDKAQLMSGNLPKLGINVADPHLFGREEVLPLFEKLRNEDPVHYCEDSPYGPYWSITKYDDIVAVDTNHEAFSSKAELGGIVIDDDLTIDPNGGFTAISFISMDNPLHSGHRKAVQPMAAPPSIASMTDLIRERTQTVLDGLPTDREFDWVSNVSIELTSMMLTTLFDMPLEDRHKLVRWSDVGAAEEGSGIIESNEQRVGEMMECLEYFTKLWNVRATQPPKFDFISMLAHDPDTKDMTPDVLLGTLFLLIIGGNDTTRNTMTGSVNALNLFPEQYGLLRNDHGLIDQMVAEVIRWQTPLAHMRRTALQDVEVGGKQIKKGDKVVMWYYSGNRDESVFDAPDALNIMRPNVRKHLAFGFGVHRCMGLRIAELQLRILWEEILKRWSHVEVVKTPERVNSNFVNGYSEMMVRLHP